MKKCSCVIKPLWFLSFIPTDSYYSWLIDSLVTGWQSFLLVYWLWAFQWNRTDLQSPLAPPSQVSTRLASCRWLRSSSSTTRWLANITTVQFNSLSSSTHLFSLSVCLSAPVEVREPPAGLGVDVQGEWPPPRVLLLWCFTIESLDVHQLLPLDSSPALLSRHQGANTVITDLCSCASLLSSSASFSSPHQLSCFRDEVLLFLYLYQRRYDAAHVTTTTWTKITQIQDTPVNESLQLKKWSLSDLSFFSLQSLQWIKQKAC